MNRQQVEAVVLKVLATILKCAVDLKTSRLNTPPWDSLKHIEIIFAVEDELDLQFSEQELTSLDSVAKIVELSQARRAA